MQISAHQYRFLKASFEKGESQKISRKVFESLYSVRNVKGMNVVKYVTETLERMIDNGWMIGYGVRTPRKWFIVDVKLTREGKKAIKEYEQKKQPRLPIRLKSTKLQAPNHK